MYSFQVEDELLIKRSHDLDSLDGGSTTSGSVSGSSRRTWTSTRRSFFKRRKGGRSSSRDSKELASYSDVASLSCADSQGALHDPAEAQINSYIRVERLDCKILTTHNASFLDLCTLSKRYLIAPTFDYDFQFSASSPLVC